MNPKWAEENLQTIRTLMERSALYRRALAPVMIFVGVIGVLGGMIGWLLEVLQGHPFLARPFVLFWSGVAAVASVGAFILVRRQALKDSEPFWSAPTKRITEALIPGFSVGVFLGGFAAYDNGGVDGTISMVFMWCLFFGCAVHSAGFFMPRGMRWFGWLFVLAGFGLIACLVADIDLLSVFHSPHLLMATTFGGLHLAYGIYLYFTEQKNPVA